MSFVYPNEQARRSCGLVTLDNIFSAYTDDLSPQLIVADDSSPDGHLLGPHQAAYCIVDFKNKLAAREVTMQFSSVMRGWNLPCLGLTIISMLFVMFV